MIFQARPLSESEVAESLAERVRYIDSMSVDQMVTALREAGSPSANPSYRLYPQLLLRIADALERKAA